MNELVFQVTFLSDIVLPATSNTEGNISQLDFIAGSAFLGMAAKKYPEFEDSFGVFHGGKVRFGDATLLCGEKQTYKMPLSYFHSKLEEETIYNQHLLDDKDFDSLRNEHKQLKQKREGYITKDKEPIFVEYSYSQKSAYDTTNRRSKESSMYGYKALIAGSSWQFVVKYDDISNKDLELIKSTLIGQKQLGKSKSAQYGLVSIELKGKSENIEDTTLEKSTVLYVNSRLALVDENGNPTLDVKYLCDGLENQVIYEKTQIRTSSFTPYNTVRQTKDYERIIINKGSVIVLEDITQKQLNTIKNGVGAFLNEGFGEIIVNPTFLSEKSFKIKQIKSHDEMPKDKMAKITDDITDSTVQFLVNRHHEKINSLELANAVDGFIKSNAKIYSNIKSSQWGVIRSICNNSTSDYTIEIKKYISNGTKKWEEKQITLLIQDHYSREFIKLLAMQMPKAQNNKGAEND